MRICILTFHKSLSYGACLQAYATWKYLSSLGIECKFIDYENEYEARMRNGMWLKYEKFFSKVKIIIKKLFFRYDYYCKKAYGNFHVMLPCIGENEIENSDVLAVGSDQTWNPNIYGKIDLMFFLAGYHNKKIALSASAGNYSFNKEENEIVKEYLKDFSGISVREKTLANKLWKNCGIRSMVILDPTLWLDRNDWLRIVGNKIECKEKYILVFVFDNTAIRETEQIIINYKKKSGLPVYQIMLNTFKKSYCNKVIAGPEPFEFVRLIDEAELVITNSFHGVAFSINMNTPFVFIPVCNNNNERMDELMTKVELKSRKVENPLNLVPMEMSFEKANELLKIERNNSLRCIRDLLKEIEYEYQ